MVDRLSPEALNNLCEGKSQFAFIDVREAGEYNSSHIPGASPAVPGEPLSDVISICYILGFRKDNTKFFNKLSLNRRHF